MKLYKLLLLIIALTSQYVHCAEPDTHKLIIMHNHNSNDNSYTISLNARLARDINPVGFITYTFINENNALICKLNIAKNYQRQGLGTELMLKALESIHNNGTSKVTWFSTTQAIPFYKRLGAREEEPDSATMAFDFKRDGDPRLNVHQHYAQPFLGIQKISHDTI